MSAVTLLLPMLVPLLGGLIASLRPDPAAAVEATPYVITFETGRDTLARDSASTRQLAVLRDLLVRHGRRPALGFVVTGFVPPDCSDGRCPQAEMLRRRVQVLVAALQAQWPSRAEPLPLDRLRWLASPRSGEPGHSGDQVVVLLERKPAAAADDCPLLEVADPALPAVVDAPGKAPWIAVASGATTPVSPASRLRVNERRKVEEPELWVETEGARRRLGRGASDERDGPIYQLDFNEAAMVIVVRPAAAERGAVSAEATQVPADERAVGNALRPWSTEPGSGSGTLSGVSSGTSANCAFRFERWVPER